jgi:general L-amino acid transport system permease protein
VTVRETVSRRRRIGIYDPWLRGVAYQLLTLLALVGFVLWVVDNTIRNLRRANIQSGFDFWDDRSGFDISQALIPYSTESTYADAFLVGLLNTLLVAVIGIIFASILGFMVGIARLSGNWLVSKIATVYVETLRNIPLLLQLLFWYKAVLGVLPGPRQSYQLPLSSSLSNRGLMVPKPLFESGFEATVFSVLAAIGVIIILSTWAKRRREETGQPFPVFLSSLAILIGVPVITFIVSGSPVAISYPELKGFNFIGGMAIRPELIALILGLVLYTATYIAEIVRAGILAVAHGQTEAAYAVGLRPGTTLRLVIIPQALRVIIPPLTNQYLNLTKNSSLAVAVGYPDLVSVFSGTALNQTGRAIEIVSLTMLVYLTFSLSTSAFMNWFNRRVALLER